VRSYEIKLNRAKDHLQALDSELRVFMRSDFYELAREDDADGLGYVDRVQHVEEIPDAVSATLGDCIQNLRSCLDHIVWEIAPPATKLQSSPDDPCWRPGYMRPVEPESKPAFPIFIAPDDFVRDGKRQIKLLPQDAQTIIERLQPGFGWDKGIARGRPRPIHHPLWVLHELSNIDKHRTIHPVAASGRLVYYRGGGVPDWGSFTARSGPLKPGAELVRVRYGSPEMARDVKVDYQLAFGVALEEMIAKGGAMDFLPKPLHRIVSFIEAEVLPPLQRFLP
jgi:hypothetical protein